MGRRWVRRKKQRTEPALNSLVGGYASSGDEDDSDGEAEAPASPWEKHVDAATGKPYWHDPATNELCAVFCFFLRTQRRPIIDAKSWCRPHWCFAAVAS